MKYEKLTDPLPGARTGTMQFFNRAGAVMLLGGALALSACVSVEAPDKPIVPFQIFLGDPAVNKVVKAIQQGTDFNV